MTLDFRSLANIAIRNLIPYQPGKPIEEVERELGITDIIKLASNENPLGASPLALVAAQEALQKAYLYPDGGCFEIKQALAKFLQVEAEQLTLGNGSENVLEIIVKAFLGEKDAAVLAEYAFLTILLLIKASGADPIIVPAQNYGHDIDAMIAAINEKTRIIFIVNPNNPTGTYTTATDLTRLLNAVPPHILVVVDEAYHEYISQPDYPDTVKLLASYPNLVITRTFSKVYGLAALRLGFAISSPAIADILNRARLPFNVNTIAAKAACCALNDHEHVKRSVELNNQGMQQLQKGFQKLNIPYIPSLGNFLTIDVGCDANNVYQKLLQKGIIIRPLTAYHLPTHLRITIGTYEQNRRFLQALEKVRN